MRRVGFILAAASAGLSVVLLAWNGFHDYREDWVYGFLAAFWSVLMMARLMTLTTPNPSAAGGGPLAQKILGHFHDRQEEDRQKILETAFGGSFALFLFAGFSLAAWLGICAAFSAQIPAVEGIATLFGAFDSSISLHTIRLFDWSQAFMLFLTFAMMGFVIRSHAGDHRLARPLLIVVAGYAVAGLIFFSGLPGEAGDFTALSTGLAGGGSGPHRTCHSRSNPAKRSAFLKSSCSKAGWLGLAFFLSCSSSRWVMCPYRHRPPCAIPSPSVRAS